MVTKIPKVVGIEILKKNEIQHLFHIFTHVFIAPFHHPQLPNC